MPDVSVHRVIAAAPAEVWNLVSDPTRYGDWSPENQGAQWLDDASGPAIGARFKGSNRNGWARWRTTCTVTEFVDGEAFVFDVRSGIPIARWGYRLEPVEVDGATHTVVTEEFTSREPKPIERLASMILRVDDRPEFNRAGMEATLAAIAAEVEPSA
ncbi:MAG: SRPBCC family protein [Ilumatobacter sp.]